MALFAVDGEAVALFPAEGEAVALFPAEGEAVALFPAEGEAVALFAVDGEAVALFAAEGEAVALFVADGEGAVVFAVEGEGLAWLTPGEGETGGGSLGEPESLADGDVDGEADFDGDGEGDALACAGSAWHTESAAVVDPRVAACAVPARPRVRKLPLSMVAAATLTCPKRIRIACLR